MMRNIFGMIFSFAFFMVGLSSGRFLLVKLEDDDRFQSRMELVDKENGKYFYSFQRTLLI